MSVGWAHSRLYSILVGGASILLSRIVSPEAFSTVRPDALEHIASELNLYLIVSRFSKLGVTDAVGQMHDVLLFLLHFKAVVLPPSLCTIRCLWPYIFHTSITSDHAWRCNYVVPERGSTFSTSTYT